MQGPHTHGIVVPRMRDDGLQVDDSIRAQRIFWTIERIAWFGFALVIVCALMGLSGAGGAFSRATADLPGGTLDHPAIARWQTADSMSVRFTGGGPTHTLTLSDAFSDAFEIRGVQPRPRSSEAVAAGLRLTFASDPDASPRATLFVTPRRPGMARYAVGIDGVPSETVGTLVLP